MRAALNPEEFRAELGQLAPFSGFSAATLDLLAHGAAAEHWASGADILAPTAVVERLYWIRYGSVRSHRPNPPGAPQALAGSARGGVDEGPGAVVHWRHGGDWFPVRAVLEPRANATHYVAASALDCLAFSADAVRRAAAADAEFDRALRSPAVLAGAGDAAASRGRADPKGRSDPSDPTHQARATVLAQAENRDAGPLGSAASALWSQQFMATPLAQLPRRAPVAVRPGTPLIDALALMHAQATGSVLVLDAQDRALGILTRHDLLPRVILAQPAPDLHRTPVDQIMSQPVQTLDTGAAVEEAALLMARSGIRHIPLTEHGRVCGLVSERDLFALQRLSITGLASALRGAVDGAALCERAPQIRDLARQLQAQGLSAQALTSLVSHLNDLLTQRMVVLMAQQHGLDLRRACWVAMGSEGRSEQTISTDQDNGLILLDSMEEPERQAWRAMAQATNRWLDACGYPLCKGGIMAGEEACCLRQSQWAQRFKQWMQQGEPLDLLNASIYFDMRPLAGEVALCGPLRETITEGAAQAPRFLRRMAENALRLRPALNWYGGLDTQSLGPRPTLDIKLHGTAVFVDAARLFALAQGIAHTSTRARFEAAGAAMGVASAECESWSAAFEWLQRLRMRHQLELPVAPSAADPNPVESNRLDLKSIDPNRIDPLSLNELDRRWLKDALRVGRQLQQRLALDWLR